MPILPSNLRFYLSGGRTNRDPASSLGGPCSDHPMVDGMGALFADVDAAQAASGSTKYRCIWFRNDDSNADGLMGPVLAKVTEQPRNQVVELGLGGAGKNQPETALASENQAPSDVEFSERIELPDAPYKRGEGIAIWVRRTVPPGSPADPRLELAIQIEGETV